MHEVIDYLVKLSDAKIQLLHTLLSLTNEQEMALKDNSIEGLNKVVNEKQDLMKRIDILDKEFLDKYETVKSYSILNEPSEDVLGNQNNGFRGLQEKIKVVLELVDKIRKVDESNMKLAKINMDESKKQLKSVRVGKKAYSSYSKKPMAGASIFMDKKE